MSDDMELTLSRARAGTLFRATLFLSVFANLLMLTGPLFMLQVYDRVLASRSEETLVALFLLVACLYAFYWLIEYARGRVMARVAARFHVAHSLRVFLATIQSAAVRHGRELGNRALHNLGAIRSLLASPTMLTLFDLPWTPVFLAAIFIFHPMLGWLALAGGGLLVCVTVLNQIITRKRASEAQGSAIHAQRLARSAEDKAELLWAQGMMEAMSRRWFALEANALEGTTSASDWTGTFTSFSKAFRLFLQSAILALGAWLVLQAEITAGAMIAASILLGRALAPVEQGLAQWPTVQNARRGWRELQAFLQDTPEPKTRTELPRPVGRLEIKNLTVVTAPAAPPILNALSLSVRPGEAIGVIGRSGSGKSTLARCCVGLVAPASGDIRLGGATLSQYGPEALGQHVGYLPQDIVLFEGTVAENISQLSSEPDATRVISSAKKARVHEIILTLPEGYDTHIGPGDTRLSGGQMQRIALARALYNDPVLLVLDEPNSALDAEGSEALNAVVSAIKEQGGAVLIMTHRPTAIAACDRLLVLEQGRVAAIGPRDEVIRSMMRNAEDVQRVVATGAAS